MKRKTLLLLVMTSFITVLHAQNSKKQQPVVGYAITAIEKGGRAWKEVRLVNINTGEEIKSIYQSTQEVQALNARTGKPVVKKELADNSLKTKTITVTGTNNARSVVVSPSAPDAPAAPTAPTPPAAPVKKVINLDEELGNTSSNSTQVYIVDENKKLVPLKAEEATPEALKKLKEKVKDLVIVRTRTAINTNINTNINNNINYHYNYVTTIHRQPVSIDKPFATNSAAMAYDKKHDRLYYTPMGINQLRYIDLKAKTPTVYFFEDEPFGVVKGSFDSPNQITRMVIASDNNGYALSNDANHLVRFTTGKKTEITDLGALTDDAANGRFSVHSSGGYGGDMVADASNNLYLITANRSVFKISIESKVATYLGNIKNLPKGFSTNGAMVEEGSKVIIASSENTTGYYRFDLTTLEAEKVSESSAVFNASDLANGNLAFDKKKKEKKQEEEKPEEPVVVKEEPKPTETARAIPSDDALRSKVGIAVYPNPVTAGFFKLSFTDQPAGKYQVQVIDISGKLINAREVNVYNKVQVEEFRIPELVSGGTYLVKISSETNQVNVTNKIVVQ